MGADLEQLPRRLRKRSEVPGPIEVVQSVHQRSPGGKRKVFPSREVGGDVLGRSVEASQHGSHHTAIIRPLVWPVRARLSVDERRHRHGVAIAEAADDGPVAIEERSKNKFEFGVIPQQSGRAKCSVESGEGRVGIRRRVEVRLQVVDGDETTRATSVDGAQW